MPHLALMDENINQPKTGQASNTLNGLADLFPEKRVTIGQLMDALQVMAGRHTLWLPERLRKIAMPREILITGAAYLAKPMRFFERWLKPRFSQFTGKTARMFLALPILILAVSIVLPIPLGNQAPSIALIAFGFGLIERDGLAILVAIILSVLAMAWLAFVIIFGVEAISYGTAYVGSLMGW